MTDQTPATEAGPWNALYRDIVPLVGERDSALLAALLRHRPAIEAEARAGCEVHPITRAEIVASEAAAVRIAVAAERERLAGAVRRLPKHYDTRSGQSVRTAVLALLQPDTASES